MRKIAVLPLLAVIIWVLSGCMGGVESRPVMIDPAVELWPGQDAPGAVVEKVVTLVPALTETAQPENTAVPAPPEPGGLQPPQAVSLAELGLEPATYRDAHSGVTVDYPAGWLLTEPIDPAGSTGYTVTFLSHLVERGPKQQEGLADSQSKFDLTIVQDRTYTYADAIADRTAAFQADDFPPTILSQEEWLLPGGLPATFFTLESRGERFSQLVTTANGRMVLLSGLGDPTVLRAISATLRVE